MIGSYIYLEFSLGDQNPRLEESSLSVLGSLVHLDRDIWCARPHKLKVIINRKFIGVDCRVFERYEDANALYIALLSQLSPGQTIAAPQYHAVEGK